MAWGDGFYRKAAEKVQARIGEPVELIGWASRSGAMGSVIAGTVEMARSKFATRFAEELTAALSPATTANEEGG